MALKEFNTARNSYRAELDNSARVENIGEMLENDPWFRKQEDDLQRYLRNVLVSNDSNDTGSRVNLGVAILNRKGITRVLDNTAKIIANKESISPYEVKRGPQYYDKNYNIEEGYKKLQEEGFFSNLLDKSKNTGSDISLAYENNAGYQIHQTTKQMMEGLSNIVEQGGMAVGWDLESTGGVNIGERNIGQHVTEFSFVKKNLLTGQQGEIFSSVIGATEEEYQEYLDIIKKYEQGVSDKSIRKYGGTPLSSEEKVTASRLAKMGVVFAEEERNAGSAIDFTSNKAKSGIINFKKFVGEKEVGILDPSQMRKGAEFLLKVGKLQREAAKVTFMGEEMAGWEAELLKGIHAIKHGGTEGRPLTAVGHNTMTFDISLLNRLFNSDKLSEGAKNVYSTLMDDKGLSFDYNLDTLALTRRFLPKDFYTEDDLKQMGKFGLTDNQQESIVRRLTAYVRPDGTRDWSRSVYDDPRNAGAAHMAVTDVLRNLEMTESLVFKETGLLRDALSHVTYNNEEPVKLEGGSRSLFFSRSHLDEKRYNLLQFTRDALSGELRTSEGFAISEGTVTGEDGSEKPVKRVKEQLFGQFGMQKGVTYQVNRLFDVTTDEKFHDIMKGMYPNLDIDKLTVLELQAYTPDIADKNIPVRAKSPIYYVGYKQDIANAMTDNTFYIGDVQGTDIDTKNVSDYVKQQMSRMIRDSEGTVIREDFDVKQVISDGAKRAEQEAAARFIRQHDYSRDKKLLEFIKYEDETIATLSEAAEKGDTKTLTDFLGSADTQRLKELQDVMAKGDDALEEKRAAFYKRLWENSVQISKDLSLGVPINTKDLIFQHSFNRILGFKDLQTETYGNLYSETLSAQIGRIGWARQNRKLIETAIGKADALSGHSQKTDIKRYYYKALLQGVEDYVETQAGKNSKYTGWHNQGVYGYEFNNKFDIDLSGYRGLGKGTIVSLNLESQPRYMVNSIIRAAKGELFTAEDYTPQERGAILRDVQDYLYRTRQIGHFTDNVSKDKRAQFELDVISGKTGYSKEFIEEFLSQVNPSEVNPYRIKQGDSETVAAYKLLRSLQNKRETGDFIGHLSETNRHMVDSALLSEVLPDEKLETVLDNIAKETPRISGIYDVDPRANRKIVSPEIVNEVVDTVLMDKRFKGEKGATYLEEVLVNAGYTSEDRRALTQIREMHKKGLQRYVSTVFNMIGDMGGQTGWDSNSRTVFAILDNKRVNLDMPVETLIDGQLQYKMGPSLLSVPVGIYDLKGGFRGQHELAMTSLIEKAVATQEGLINWHTRQALIGNGTKLFRLEKVMSSISKTIREAPSVTEVGLKSRGNQFKVQYGELLRNLPALLGNNPSQVDSWLTDDSFKNIIKDLATGKATFDSEYPAYEHYLAGQANLDQIILTAFRQNIISKEQWENIMSNFTAAVKGAEKLAGQASYQGDVYTRWNKMGRNAPGIEDANKLNVSKIVELRDKVTAANVTLENFEDYEGLRDVGIGKGLTDNATYQHAVAGSKEGRQFNTHVQLNVLHASPTSLNAVIMDNLGEAVADIYNSSNKQELISEGSMNLLATAMPDEGVMFMHGHIFDRIFSERDTIQKLGLRKVIDSDGKTIFELQKKAAAMPFFDLISDDNGKPKIQFSYGSGSFVAADDIIGHTPGFGISPHGERAKYEGLLKLGAFDLSSGHLVEESEISRVINESLDISDLNQLSKDERAKKIVDLLEKRYNLAYYLQTERANPLVKLAEMAEKGMTRALILGTGEADDRIAAVMQKLGFYGGNYIAQERDVATGKKQVTKTLGRVDALDIKLIDDLLREDLGSFLTAAKGRYSLLNRGKSDYKELDKAAVEAIFKEQGFDSAADFRRAVLHERYEPTRLMAKVLQKADIINPDKETFHIISNHIANVKKHGDISAYRYLTDEWIFREDQLKRQGILTEDKKAANLVRKYLLDTSRSEYKGTVERRGDSIVLSKAPDALEADMSKLRKAYVETGLVDFTDRGRGLSDNEQKQALQKYYDTGDLSEGFLRLTTQRSKEFILGEGVFKEFADQQKSYIGQYEKTRADVSRVGHYWDWAKETYDAVKFNQRAITILGNMRVDEHGKENVRKFLDERSKAYGGIDSDIYDTFIKDLQKGEIVNSAAIDQIYRNMFNRAGGGEKLSGFVATDEHGNLKWGIDQGAVQRFVRNYNIAHGDEQKGVNIMTALLGRLHQGLDGRSITTVNEAGAFNLWKAFSATAANSVNQGVIQTTVEAERLGFKKIKLEDLMTGKLGAGDFDESLYGHNWLIDLGEHSKFGDRLYKDSPYKNTGRYLAIAADHIEKPGEFREAIADRPQEKLKLVQDEIDRYLSAASNGEFEGEEGRKEAFNRIVTRLQDVRDAQYNIWAGKGGMMAEATKAWMHDAYRATSKGQNLLGTESVDTALGKATQVDNIEELQDLVKKRRIDAQGKAIDISKLSINGISLVEEAKKGKNALQFNYSILSLERMNKIYDKGFGEISDALVNAGADKKLVDKLISEMSSATKKIAQTEGVEGISAREPLQYYGSVTQRRIFFNSLASGNEAIGDFVGAQARKEDFDSDAVVNALHKEQAELTIGDKKVNIEVDSAMLSALNSQAMKDAGVSVRLLDEGAEERFKRYKVSQFFTGAGEMQRYRTIAGFEGGYNFKPINSLNFEDLKSAADSYSPDIMKKVNVLPSTYQTFGERQEAQRTVLREVYKNMVKQASFNLDTFGEDFLMASGETQRVRLLEEIEKQAAQAGQSLSSDDFNLAYEAVKFSMSDKQLATDLMAFAGRVPTGKMNRYTQNIFDVTQEVLHNEGAGAFFGKDVGLLTNQMGLVNLAMQEGFLSPKNERMQGSVQKTAEELRAELMPSLEKAYNAVFSLGDNAIEKDRAAAKKQLADAMLNVVLQRSTKEIHRDPSLPTLQELLKDEKLVEQYGVNYQALATDTLGKAADGSAESVLERTARNAVNATVDFIVDNVAWRGNKKNIFNFGTSNARGNKSNTPLVLPRQSNQAPIQLNALIGDTMEDLGVKRGVLLSEPVGYRSKANELSDFTREVTHKETPPIDISSVPNHDKEKIAALTNEVRKAKGKTILGAAVGIAGGLMISGFANNPSKKQPLPSGADSAFGNAPIPSQSLPDSATHMASDGSVMSQYPISLADNNLNVSRGAPSRAYVINISGTSPGGERAALDAIQSSVAGPIPQNSSINIAMNNNYTDTLSQAQVGRMVQTAMGF